MKFLILFAFLIISPQIKGLTIECEYGDYFNFGYTCDVIGVFEITSSEITEVRGHHVSGKTNDDVNGFTSGFGVLKIFPHNLTHFFKNLDKIQIHNSNIKSITKDDLKQFNGKLKVLQLQGNEIDVIKSDLFDDNKNLEIFWVYNNKIRHVEEKALDGLENLIWLSFSSNPCTSHKDEAEDSWAKVLAVIRSVEQKCKDPNYN